MTFEKNYLAVALVAASLVGCGGDSNNSSSDTTNPSPSYSFLDCNTAGDECYVTGTINEDFTMSADVKYILEGLVRVGRGNIAFTAPSDVTAAQNDGVTLTIEAGSDVRAENSGILVVTRGSKLMAEGTAAAPITFSSVDEGLDGMAEWGGVIVQGFAPQYGQGNTGACFAEGPDDTAVYTETAVCNVTGEGGDGVGKYGGNIPGDNSGVIKYVRIAEAGKSVGVDNEVNGLTLMGVGHGTTIDYIQVHNNLDDGIEWFGGTVNVTHAVLTGNDDDDIDFDSGYMGNVQFAIVVKNQAAGATPSGSNDPRGIEGNSDKAKSEQTPQTHAAIANVTLIGGEINDGQPGIKLRGQVEADLAKIVVTGFTSGCYEMKDSEETNVSVQDLICDGTLTLAKNDEPASGTPVSSAAAITFNAAGAAQNAEVTDGITADFTAVDNGSNFAFEATTYAGAVNPDGTDDWTTGWIIPGSLDALTSVNAPE
ncbi:hypothetical protein [Thalassolituus oleivorans]|jgi:hypothetical protein|uniref:hypothetical protein n=1 Tax=Thalassolituus oleivorans TaxID=187493 RepID=UPI002409FBCC|nr:hypothetical protein [Thalassolituus oleivorans]MDF1639785.1 hypothetical protein [Thalassolituus oleivorans]